MTDARDDLLDTADLSPASVALLVRAFEDGTLPRERWRHGMHLLVGLWYVLDRGPDRAFRAMSRGIQRYNATTGRTAEERDGFSADVTRTWICRIAHFARAHAGKGPAGTLFRRILTDPLCPCSGEPATATWGACSASGSEPPPRRSPSVDAADVTRLLTARARGEDVVHDLFALVYDELCSLAERRMLAERPDHTLQATALVHEAYARLVRDAGMEWTSRRHFFGAAAQAMRRILVDHARHLQARRRADDEARMMLDTGLADGGDPDRLLALDDALAQLAQEDPRAAEVVHLRFFAGLDLEQTARALDLSVRSVSREWRFARTRLHELLNP